MTEPRFLRTAEVARRLHVSSKTVARYARLKMLPHTMTPGGHRRYPEAAVVELEERLADNGVPAARLAEPVEEAS